MGRLTEGAGRVIRTQAVNRLLAKLLGIALDLEAESHGVPLPQGAVSFRFSTVDLPPQKSSPWKK